MSRASLILVLSALKLMLPFLRSPLLNLQSALGGGASPSPSLSSSAGSSSFGVKRRWDDDVIFKNQSMQDEKTKPEFVNDLLRTQYHRKFIKRYVA